jgi:hypothetical protein
MAPGKWIRIGLGACLLLGCMPPPAAAKVDSATRLLEKGCSLLGPTGWINLPTADVPASGDISAAIHRGEAKVNISLFGLLEGGIYFEADKLGMRFEKYRNLSSWELIKANVPAFLEEAFRGQAKLKLADQDWLGLGLAAGCEQENLYGVAERYFPELAKVTVVAGWGTGRFGKGFGGLSKAVAPGSEFILEYDGTGVNAGVRLLLARNLVFSLAILDLNSIGEVQNLGEVIGNHLLFGITFVERTW